jgi:hypothetical protein
MFIKGFVSLSQPDVIPNMAHNLHSFHSPIIRREIRCVGEMPAPGNVLGCKYGRSNYRLNIVTWYGVTINKVLDCLLDLLTTLTRNS